MAEYHRVAIRMTVTLHMMRTENSTAGLYTLIHTLGYNGNVNITSSLKNGIYK